MNNPMFEEKIVTKADVLLWCRQNGFVLLEKEKVRTGVATAKFQDQGLARHSYAARSMIYEQLSKELSRQILEGKAYDISSATTVVEGVSFSEFTATIKVVDYNGLVDPTLEMWRQS